jgi:uncharacterized protein (TIGR03084 family)
VSAGSSIFDDLDAEETRLEQILQTLDDAQWRSPSGADGWSVGDVVLHLAQSEGAVVASARRGEAREWRRTDGTVDGEMDALVQAERADPTVVFERWCRVRRDALDALRTADPEVRLTWAAAPLKPATMATTRLAEHWAHGLDVTGPLGIPFPDTGRLRHIAWLGHGSLAYAFQLVGEEPHEVRVELVAPGGSTWTFGPEGADSAIRGDAGAFCRVGARRLAPDASGLATEGPYGDAALRALRNYAG